MGTLAHEITDAGRVIDVGVLPADLFQARVYRGATQQHGVEDRDAASVVIRVPNETVQRLSSPNRDRLRSIGSIRVSTTRR